MWDDTLVSHLLVPMVNTRHTCSLMFAIVSVCITPEVIWGCVRQYVSHYQTACYNIISIYTTNKASYKVYNYTLSQVHSVLKHSLSLFWVNSWAGTVILTPKEGSIQKLLFYDYKLLFQLSKVGEIKDMVFT